MQKKKKKKNAGVARSVARPSHSDTFFRDDLVIKIFLRPFFQEEQFSVDGERMFTKYPKFPGIER